MIMKDGGDEESVMTSCFFTTRARVDSRGARLVRRLYGETLRRR